MSTKTTAEAARSEADIALLRNIPATSIVTSTTVVGTGTTTLAGPGNFLVALTGLTGPVTVNMPSPPAAGQVVTFIDVDGSCSPLTPVHVNAAPRFIDRPTTTSYTFTTPFFAGSFQWTGTEWAPFAKLQQYEGITKYMGPSFSEVDSNEYEVQTVDGTVGVLLASILIPASAVTNFTAEVSGKRTNGADAGGTKETMSWNRVGAGAPVAARASVLESDNWGTNGGALPAGWAVTWVAVGNQANLIVTGAVGMNIDWGALVQWQVVS